MPSTYTSGLRLVKQAVGENNETWGTVFNQQFADLIDVAVAGYLSIAMSDANITLTAANGASDQSRYAILDFTGTLTANRSVVVPASSKIWAIRNSTSGGFSLVVTTASGSGVTITNGSAALVACDGTNVITLVSGTGGGGVGTVSSVGATVPSFLSISGSPVTSTGTLAISYSGTALPVANGGSGATSLTAYAPLFGGTTSTGAVQSGTVGTSGQVLTSNGAGALPTFQTVSTLVLEDIVVACSDETTPITTGTKRTFQLMRARTLLAVAASLTTAQTSGSIVTIDIKKNGVSMLSTLLSIDNTETTSSTATTPAVISTTAIAAYDTIAISVSQIGDGTAAGLKVMFFWGFPP